MTRAWYKHQLQFCDHHGTKNDYVESSRYSTSHQKYAQTLQGKLSKNKVGTENTNYIAKQCYSNIVELQIHQINHSETKTERFSSYLTVNKIYFHYRTKSFNSAHWNNHSLLWETYRIRNYTPWHNVEFLSLKPCHTMKLLGFFLYL